MKCEMTAKTPLNATEDVDKVIIALSNLFDYDQIEVGGDYIQVTGDGESLLKLKESLERRKIRSTARKILLKGAREQMIFFKLNKQTAYSGVVNFSEEKISPLGEVKVKIETSNVDKFIDWLAPSDEI